jgi:aspartyl protease family protein
MKEFPSTLKHLTVWLLVGTAVFLGIQLWQAQQRASRFVVDTQGVIELRRAPDGHFHWPGTVNGRQVDFLVDTGATRTALPLALAEGLPALGTVRSATAGGVVQGHVVRADLVLQGGVRVSQLPITVLPQLGAPLLGMDVLSRLNFSQSDGVLRLQAPR